MRKIERWPSNLHRPHTHTYTQTCCDGHELHWLSRKRLPTEVDFEGSLHYTEMRVCVIWN